MTDTNKPEELSEDDLGQVTGGTGATITQRPKRRMEVVNEDEVISTNQPKSRMEVVNEDEFNSSASGDPNV